MEEEPNWFARVFSSDSAFEQSALLELLEALRMYYFYRPSYMQDNYDITDTEFDEFEVFDGLILALRDFNHSSGRTVREPMLGEDYIGNPLEPTVDEVALTQLRTQFVTVATRRSTITRSAILSRPTPCRNLHR